MQTPARRIRFGLFELDVSLGELRKGPTRLKVPYQSIEILKALLERPGELVTRDELRQRLWPSNTFVDFEHGLNAAIRRLREALGDSADSPKFVETLPRRGYRFIGDTERLAPLSSRPDIIPPPSPGETSSEALADVAPPPATAAPAADLSTPDRPGAGRHSRGRLVARPSRLLLVAASGIGLAVAVYLAASGNSRRATTQVFGSLATPLTAYPGFEEAPTLSPDGSQVAFSWNGPGQDNFDIYVKLAGPGEAWRLTRHAAPDDKPAWSPDGARIAFLRFVSENATDLMVIPALGGAERKIATIYPTHSPDRPFRNLSWTRDGRWLAFGGRLTRGGPQGIWLIAADGQERRRLTDGPPDDDMGDFSPVPSPDGSRIAFIRERTFNRSALFVLPFRSGEARDGSAAQLTSERWGLTGVAWSPDGRDLLFSWGGHFGLSRLGRISATSNRGPSEPAPLPFGEQATGLAISESGRIVYSAQFRDTAFYQAPLTGGSYQPLGGSGFSSTFDEQTPHYAVNGERLAFTSTRSGAEEIWVANSAGSSPVQLTTTGGPQCSTPQWSPDGKTILFNSRREGPSDLYLLVPETGELRRLTREPSDEIEARWSRDGRWIYFGSNRSGRYEIWRISAAGGDLKQITRHGGTAATESPDSRYLYYAKEPVIPSSIWRVPVEGGAEEHFADDLSYSLNFVVGDRGVYFLAVGDAPDKTSIDFVEFASGARTRVVDLGKRWWYGMTLAPDGKSLVFSLVNSAGSNLMLVESFR